jgi:hypothetical protein
VSNGLSQISVGSIVTGGSCLSLLEFADQLTSPANFASNLKGPNPLSELARSANNWDTESVKGSCHVKESDSEN